MAKRPKACKNSDSCSKKDCGKNCATSKTQSIPLKVNVNKPAAQVIEAVETPALPSPQPQQLTSDTSPTAIRDQASRFYDLFDRYNRLRALARPLNGLPQTSPYPAHVKITKVDIEFTINGLPHTATISGSQIVGELASLIANELSSLIEQMYTEIFTLNHVAAAMQKAIEDAIVPKSAPAAGAVADNSTIVEEQP